MFVLPAMVAIALGAVEAPITDVTVYSDRARVTRTAKAPVSGTQAVELPVLLDSIDVGSLRVEAEGAEVVRVDIQRVEPDGVPMDEAKALLKQLEKLDDEIARLRADRDVHQRHVKGVFAIVPQAPEDDPLKPPQRLDSSGWPQAVSFLADNAGRSQARVRELTQRIDELERERSQVADKAELLGGAQRRAGYRVTPLLSGSGTATLKITYLAGPARWFPSYDLQLAPEKGRVQVAFSGLVSQETGEDWSDARLTLSTAEPGTAMMMPELSSWKIGERDRFVPTPYPKQPYVKPPPPVEPVAKLETEEALWERRLMARAESSPGVTTGDNLFSGTVVGGSIGTGAGAGRTGGYDLGASATAQGGRSEAYGQAPNVDMPSAAKPSRTRAKASPPPAAPREAAPAASYDEGIAVTESESSGFRFSGLASSGPPPVTSTFNLAPPSVYRAPSYSPELPVSLAGGYDLSWSSLQRESVGSGKGARRVALFAQQWPVNVERRVFPALAPEAYLVAQLKSPSPTPLPGGNAQLFVGADPAGTARLELVAPGETFTLPLGLDRAIKPIRNVELVTTEKGVIGKDDVNRYVVRTEIANPYRFPIFLKIYDQWPVTDDEDVEVKLLETKPWALQEPVKGALEWHLTVPANSKQEVSFTYSIRRPRGWRLHQQ